MQNFKNGYNCAQAVLLAFSDELEIDEKTLALISSSFGGGMGRMREVCGAVSGMFMVAGLKYGYSDPSAKQEKAELYALVQNLAAGFKEKNGSIICKELLKFITSLTEDWELVIYVVFICNASRKSDKRVLNVVIIVSCQFLTLLIVLIKIF